jgi:hypothetical protein
MEDSKDTATPKIAKTALDANEECEHVDQKKYRILSRSLLYLTTTRADIQFSVSLCTRFQASPRTSHRQEVKHIFWYLRHSLLRPLALRVFFFTSSWFFRRGFCQVSVG